MVFSFLVLFLLPARAAVYYVDRAHPLASDGNLGTSRDLPWATIAKANSTLHAGDVVHVFPGVYNEVINPANSGSAGNFISYIADTAGGVIVRQAPLLNKNHIRIKGFEITHDNLAYTHGITLYASHYCEILDNTIHHVQGQAIRNNSYYGNSNHNAIRGNIISYAGCPRTGNPLDWTGSNAIVLLGSYNLVEYNDVSHTLDFFDLNGGYNVIRNNYTHDFANSDFPNGPGDGAHVDFWQPFSTAGNLTVRNVVESNFARDIYEANSHFFQVRDELLLGIGELIIRGNVGLRFGSYVAQFGAADYTRSYNNTFVDFAYNQAKPWSTVIYTVESPATANDPSTNNHNFNNIYFNVCRPDGYIIYMGAGCTAQCSHNAAEGSGFHPSCSVTADIHFTNYAGDDFALSAASACINAGIPMTTIQSPSGSGSSFVVADAGFFSDGHGVVEGDLVKIGANGLARIVAISGNTISVDRAITWNSGDPLNWRYQDASPDIGAYEFEDRRLTAAAISGSGSDYTVATSGDARFVVFFRDGIPQDTDHSPPYTATISGGVVTAKAYALHAQANPVVTATPAAQDQQTIHLVTGWNWISFNVLPADRSLNSVFAGILGRIEQVKSQGQSAIHSGGQWLGDLSNMEGIRSGMMYKVKVNTDCTLTVTGARIAANTPIQLVAGWNWIAYYPTNPLPTGAALQSITGQVQQVKSQFQSAIYVAGVWQGDLMQMVPSPGYSILMTGAADLTFPSSQTASRRDHW